MGEGGESGGREGWVHKALLPVLYLSTKECQVPVCHISPQCQERVVFGLIHTFIAPIIA